MSGIVRASVTAFAIAAAGVAAAAVDLPGADPEYENRLRHALAAARDVFGEEVLATGEPSFDTVKDYLRPLMLANTEEKRYRLLLSDIAGTTKAMATSDGSRIHMGNRGVEKGRIYRVPDLAAVVRVGNDGLPFGGVESDTHGPHLKEGWMPVYTWRFRHQGVNFKQRLFARDMPDVGLVVFWRMDADATAKVEVALEAKARFEARDVRLIDPATSDCWARFAPGTSFDTASQAFRFDVSPDRPACLALAGRSAPWDAVFKGDVDSVEQALDRCEADWRAAIDGCARIHVPEERVNHAWRALVAGILMMCNSDSVRYSALNAYQKEYANETPNTIATLDQLGLHGLARRFFRFQIPYVSKQGTELNAAAWRLNTVCDHCALTGDRDFFEAHLDGIRRWADTITNALKRGENGLLPKCAYAWDKPQIQVINVVVNSLSWRALRSFGRELENSGRRDDAAVILRQAAALRSAILEAVDRSVVKDGDQTFLPLSLLGDEKPYSQIPATTEGTYYNIAISPLFHAGVFPHGNARLRELADYQENRGGVMLGLLRTGRPPEWSGYMLHARLCDLYGWPRANYMLQSGQVGKFLLSFYSKLAHGLTRDTFVGGEATTLELVKGEYYRRMTLPPNSFSNASFLLMLRAMLVMEQDADDDGTSDRLVLAAGTPRAWLQPGQRVSVEVLPTCFGPVNFDLAARADGGGIDAEVTLAPRRIPRAVVLHVRVPEGKTVASVTVNGHAGAGSRDEQEGRILLPADEGRWTIDVRLK